VIPQITIPFGHTLPVQPRSGAATARQARAASAGGIDDAVARCKAQNSPSERARCRERLAREARAR
jgi:hypothetical protein